ncbi:MAG TPA: MBL fold metallo-hydrolase [Ferrovibrio sp.]|jgi:L-ascorbate metabolism protein UlaG (beta-lactamase superfamily)|uniref:MBL fold metallo-hydrolase n=1 Tax=Ferrovibrio sp. TaxID=1917215 RepID=UPI002B4AF5AB|nr:MBL fold metallo-hydrolase [Ferrovibrio sp.]HLT77367.1 MBL fold metallo-hydrolase [Ferrovibrio sp.]
MDRRAVLTVALLAAIMLLAPAGSRAACLGAVSQLTPRIVPAGLRLAAAPPNSARITFVGHATFLIETPQGATAATDYNDYIRPMMRPDVVTMNYAHSTHYTNNPEPGIAHVLRGWTHEGKPARHNVQFRDLKVRNVPTNLRSYDSGTEYDGNSIFIFDVADLCIAHLGHLHHKLTPGHLADIGRIDVLFVPVDGGFTLNIVEMQEVVAQLQAPLVIPMHYFSEATLERFLARMRDSHEIRLNDSATVVVSRATLPKQRTLLVLPGPH